MEIYTNEAFHRFLLPCSRLVLAGGISRSHQRGGGQPFWGPVGHEGQGAAAEEARGGITKSSG